MTSHDVVARVRRKLGTRRVGHAGTLDPDATGVLVLCIGSATRLLEYIVADHKVYRGSAVFGQATTTDDASGEIVAEASAEHLQRAAVERALASFVGTTTQRVPAYSAVHIDGIRAYERARRGEAVVTPTRTITIETAKVLDFVPGVRAQAEFVLACSKGTYIRAVCRDWGEVLGVPAHMGTLRRMQSGQFDISAALPLGEWEQSSHPDGALLPESEAVRSLPRIELGDAYLMALTQGKQIPAHCATVETIAVFSERGELAAIGTTAARDGQVWIQPKKVFWKREE